MKAKQVMRLYAEHCIRTTGLPADAVYGNAAFKQATMNILDNEPKSFIQMCDQGVEWLIKNNTL
jgi:antitoxin component of RelBE/YafQ-DinJ toxin-antitoxin module